MDEDEIRVRHAFVIPVHVFSTDGLGDVTAPNCCTCCSVNPEHASAFMACHSLLENAAMAAGGNALRLVDGRSENASDLHCAIQFTPEMLTKDAGEIADQQTEDKP